MVKAREQLARELVGVDALSPDDVAEELGVNRWRVGHLLAAGRIGPAVKFRGLWWISPHYKVVPSHRGPNKTREWAERIGEGRIDRTGEAVTGFVFSEED